MAGYSSASLQKKLGIKPDMSWSAPNAPDGFGADFEDCRGNAEAETSVGDRVPCVAP